ncbi:MAG: cytochrome c oxidase assembly protein [Rhizobiaceae bacterium]
MSSTPIKPAGNNKRVVTICLGVTFGMLGMAYAAVPLYEIFCQVTGYAGTTQRAADTTGTVLEKTIKVRFDANIANDLEWDFAPKQREMTLKLGEKKIAYYKATNTGKTESYGTATFNVSPGAAGVYFNKIDCFCFTEQKLKAGEQVDMPVVFFVDPDIVNDPLLKDATTITLSYTFFSDEDAEQEVTENSPPQKDGGLLKSSL